MTNTRYIIIAGGTVTDAGDNLETAKGSWLRAIADHQTTDVTLAERVPIFLHDTRSSMGAIVRLGEKVQFVQQAMLEHSWPLSTVATWVRFGEETLRKILAGEELKASQVEEIYNAMRRKVAQKRQEKSRLLLGALSGSREEEEE